MVSNGAAIGQHTSNHAGFSANALSLKNYGLNMVQLASVAYYIGFALYVTTYYLNSTTLERVLFIEVDHVFDVGRVLCVLLLLIKLLLQTYNKTQLFGLLATGFIAVTSLYISGDWNLVLLFLFVTAGSGISVKKLSKVAFPIQLSIIAIAVVFAAAGAIDVFYMYRNVDGVLQLRSSLGFSHPNQFGQAVLGACCSYAILRFPKFRVRDLVVYLPAALACNAFADSRTAVACIVLVIVMSFISHLARSRRRQRAVLFIATAAAMGCMGFSLFMMVMYNLNVQWMHDLNSVISSRLSMAHSYYQLYPPNLFGHQGDTLVVTVGSYTQRGPDNAYVRMLLRDGILPTAVFLIAYILTFLHFYRRDEYNACIFGMLIYAVVAVMESNSLHFALNFCLVGIAWMIYGTPESEKKVGSEESLTDDSLCDHRSVHSVGV